MLTSNMRYVIRDGEHVQEALDMRTERSANLRTIDALRAGLRHMEGRLARELHASNAEAYSRVTCRTVSSVAGPGLWPATTRTLSHLQDASGLLTCQELPAP